MDRGVGGWGRSDFHGVIYLSWGEGTSNRPGPSSSEANINTNPGLNFNPGFFYFVWKHFSWWFSPFSLENPILKLLAKWIKLDFLLKPRNMNWKFALTPRYMYLNPSFNNPALCSIIVEPWFYEVLGITNDSLHPVIVKYIEKHLDIMKSRLPVPWFHCIGIMLL